MKKFLLFSCLAVLTQFAPAQVVPGGDNLRDLDLQYVEIFPPGGIGGVVRINYGQSNNLSFLLFDPLVDAEGKPFRNTIAALNYLYQNGWEVFAMRENGVYLMKRRNDFQDAADE